MGSYKNERLIRWYDDPVRARAHRLSHIWSMSLWHGSGPPPNTHCSSASRYKAIVCEECIAKEYGLTVEELRNVMQEHFGLLPCPGI